MDHDELVKTLKDAMDQTTLTHYGRKGMKWYQHIFGSDRKGSGSRAPKSISTKFSKATKARATAKAAKAAYKLAKANKQMATVQRRSVQDYYGPVFGRQARKAAKKVHKASKQAAKVSKASYKSAKRSSKLADKELRNALKEWEAKQKKRKSKARHSMPEGDSLTHYGVKGSKWGYNKGRKNGKRTAGTEVSNLDEMNALRAKNLTARVRAELNKRDKWAAASKASSAAQSKGRAELERRRRVREATAAAVARAKQRKTSKNNRKNANSKDAASIRSARSASSTASRKKRNRQLNRIDGVRVGNKATNRQIAMYYDRRNRKNLKNA